MLLANTQIQLVVNKIRSLVLRSEKATFHPRTYIIPGQERRHIVKCQVKFWGALSSTALVHRSGRQLCKLPTRFYSDAFEYLRVSLTLYIRSVHPRTPSKELYTKKMADWVGPPSNLLVTNGVRRVGAKSDNIQIATVDISGSLTKEPQGSPPLAKRSKAVV